MAGQRQIFGVVAKMDADSSANITHTNVLTAALTSAMSADSTVCKRAGIDRVREIEVASYGGVF